jgi:hypothetical protein
MQEESKSPRKKKEYRIIALIVLAIILLLMIIIFTDRALNRGKELPIHGDPDSSVSSFQPGSSGIDITESADSLTGPESSSAAADPALPSEDFLKKDRRILHKTVHDTSKREDSDLGHEKERSLDTVPPVLIANPTGGLYYQPVTVNITGSEPCSIFFLKSPNPIADIEKKNITSLYSQALYIDKNTILYFFGTDTAGNSTRIKVRRYDINPNLKNPCPRKMAFIFSRDKRLCMDQYEWPNRRYKIPVSFVSWSQANDSCTSLGKRLCTSEEWYNACSDFGRQPYPYGDIYENKSCVTEKENVQKSGRYSECMSYFGIYDMSGNLAEWTSTKAEENPDFYKVMGGYWSAHSASSCSNYKYSFYPQNQSVSVGFRCCFDP